MENEYPQIPELDLEKYNKGKPKVDQIITKREAASYMMQQLSRKFFAYIGMAASPILAMLLTPLNMYLGFGFAILGMAIGGYFAMRAKQEITYMQQEYGLD